MIGRGFRARVWAAGVAACAAAGVAPAQFAAVGVASPGVPCVTGECAAANRGSYGPAFFAPNRCHGRWLSSSQPACANNNFPLSDWAYIRKYCGPTLIPGTPYGHFQTKWRKWEDHAGGCATGVPDGVVIGDPVVPPPAPPVAESMPAPNVPLTAPNPLPKTGDAKPADPAAPPKLPTIPKQVNAEVPAAPVQLPPLPQPMPTSDKPAPEPSRIIIPPLPELPSKRS